MESDGKDTLPQGEQERPMSPLGLTRTLSSGSLIQEREAAKLREEFRALTEKMRNETSTSLQYFESHLEKFTTFLQEKKSEERREIWMREMCQQLKVLKKAVEILEQGPAFPAKVELEAKHSKKEKSNLQKLLNRLVFGILMIAGFLYIIMAGHIYVIFLVAFLQVLTFRELANVRFKAVKARHVPMFRTIQWCWFSVAMFYVYSDGLQAFLKETQYGHLFASLQDFLSFSLYSSLFCITVLSFKKGFYKYQMQQLAWTFITIFMIVFQMKFAIENIKAGLFWFLLPCSLVICNDCMAYFCGKAFGHKLINYPFMKISPNKTWEGFIGAYLFTCIFAFVYPLVLVKSDWLIYSLADLTKDTSEALVKDPVFEPKTYEVPAAIGGLVGIKQIRMLPVQMHSVLLGMFASLVAPFGGFFASAVKRAYDIKDFDALIPGHGGIMDRMDCQFIMAMCTGVHYTTFIRPKSPCSC
uniref:phosphatidate cytidylyltransferase n=1 Tax=Amorphochlora amoebiformis TaxID=1561963 RepID=A0A7S0DAQ8_9EUKA|mmetsp:Transcript_22896/g.35942  ORF Transcript_22896/g.35942 Transcript_22896/m.35942 type:complete len:470 (+) Transcript_22896:20-1429(+)